MQTKRGHREHLRLSKYSNNTRSDTAPFLGLTVNSGRAASPVVRLIVERLPIFQFQKLLLGFLSLFDQNLEQLNVRKLR
jgi:hypothetical protein